MISVVMPAKNAASTIRESIESVLHNDTLGELLVIDDTSTDDTLETVRLFDDPRIKLLHNPGNGIADAFNHGVTSSKFELIARCDADDLFPADRLERQFAFLNQNSDFIAIAGAFTIIDKHGRATDFSANSHISGQEISNAILARTITTSFCTWLFRKSIFVSIGMLRPWFKSAEDIDIQFRMSIVGKIWFDPRAVYHYRLVASSITHSMPTTELEFYENAAISFAEQRLKHNYDDLDFGEPPALDSIETETNNADVHLAELLEGLAWKALKKGNRLKAIKNIFWALKLCPFSLRLWRGAASLLLKTLHTR